MDGNVMQMVQTMLTNNPELNNNPVISNALKMAQSGDSRAVRNLAENVCREKGINISEIARQFNLKL